MPAVCTLQYWKDKIKVSPEMWPTFLFFGLLFLHFGCSLIGVSNTLLDMYGFRQTQTALTSYFISISGVRLDYWTPVLGFPWSIPFEFPLFQWIVAGLASFLPINLDIIGRVVSLCFFYATLIFVNKCLMSWFSKSDRQILMSFMLLHPIYLFWSRTFMIESLAVFLGAGYVYFLLNTLTSNVLGRLSHFYLFMALVFGTLCGLVKITTFSVFLVAGAALSIAKIVSIQTEQTHVEQSNKTMAMWLLKHLRDAWLVLLITIAAPILISYWWTWWADSLKALNPIGAHLTSSALQGWNFGTIEQRISWQHWKKCINNDGLTVFLIFLVLISVLCPSIRQAMSAKFRSARAMMLFVFLSGPLLFFNLYWVHNYYWYANSLFVSIAIGTMALSILQSGQIKNTVRLASIFLMMATLSYPYWVHDLPIQRRNHRHLELLTQYIATHTLEGDVVAVLGADWDSSIPYYARRKALMIPGWKDPRGAEVSQAFLNTGIQNIKLFVVADGYNPSIVAELNAKLGMSVECSTSLDGYEIFGRNTGTGACPGSAEGLPIRQVITTAGLSFNTNIAFFFDRVAEEKGVFNIEGWAFIPETPANGSQTFIALQSSSDIYFFDVKKRIRPDVADHFKNENYYQSGFFASIKKKALKPGTYLMGVYIEQLNVQALRMSDKQLVIGTPVSN